MIPKIIHYCWFGKNPKPKLANKCYKSWKKYCPDYQIIEWNEDNYDINSAPLYVQQAYKAKKWAFVTDYVRLKVVYEYGGIYLDTDVEVIKCLDDLLTYSVYFGSEGGKYISTGLGFGAEKGNTIVQKMMNDYNEINFIKEDGTYDLLPCPKRNTEAIGDILNKDVNFDKMYKTDELVVFPPEFFCPLDFDTREMKKTKRTYSIHWFDASWLAKEEKDRYKQKIKDIRKDYLIHIPNRILKNILGEYRYKKIKNILKK